MKRINRRHLLLTAGGTIGLSALALANQKVRLIPRNPLTYLSAADNRLGKHFLVGLNADTSTRFAIETPNRLHEACYIKEERMAVFMSRRPERWMYIVDTLTGKLLPTASSPSAHHVYGHSTYNSALGLLYITENEIETGKGIVGIYQAKPPFKRLGQFDSGGIGPHQIIQLNQKNMLVVANGGILTHPGKKRRKLNLPSMRPNLTYIDLTSGEIHSQVEPPHHQLSIRHIAVTQDDVVIVSAQDQSKENPTTPLIWEHRINQPLTPMTTGIKNWADMNQYIASVCVSENGQHILSTSPKGGIASLWNTRNQSNIKHFKIRDVAGAAWDQSKKAFVLSNGLGELWAIDPTRDQTPQLLAKKENIRWDNHLTVID